METDGTLLGTTIERREREREKESYAFFS